MITLRVNSKNEGRVIDLEPVGNDALMRYLSAFRLLREGHRIEAERFPLTAEEWIEENGIIMTERKRMFSSQVKPKSRQCYFNAWKLHLLRPALQYCEGFMLLPNMPIAVQHGWCIDERGRIHDPSVEQQEPAFYCGVAFKNNFAAAAWKRLLEDQAIGIMGNLWKLKEDYDWLKSGVDQNRMQQLSR